MIDKELRRRVKRILSGARSIDDLNRIFLDQRSRSHGKASFLEIGDFVAHRDRREKGPVTEVVRDIFASAQFWLSQMFAKSASELSLDDFRVAARANLRLATDEQIKSGCGLRREVARSVLERAIKKLDTNPVFTARERQVLNYFGGRFIWNPAFTDDQLFGDCVSVLTTNQVLEVSEAEAFKQAKTFITLFAITQMHGSAIILANGIRANLFAGFSNRQRQLEVKAQLIVPNFAKPIIIPCCVFWTALDPIKHCDAGLIDNPMNWNEPIEVRGGATLAVVG